MAVLNTILAALSVIAIVGVIFGFIYKRKLKTERAANARTLQQMQHDKDKDSIRHRATDLEIRTLRSQMNPHFIFNSLSSINKYIIRNETDAASDYLTRFSRFIRMVLINSAKPMISLEDELYMLRIYLDLERLRFNDAFDYNITLTNNVEPSTVFLPPLLFQPFCENAIWHGLMHKTELGELKVVLSRENDSLHCSITDNGVGRNKAEVYQSKSAQRRKSLGLKITDERLALMNNDNSMSSSYKVGDIRDEFGNISGTEVNIIIRYKEVVEV